MFIHRRLACQLRLTPKQLRLPSALVQGFKGSKVQGFFAVHWFMVGTMVAVGLRYERQRLHRVDRLAAC
jgi:hypothetical protein